MAAESEVKVIGNITRDPELNFTAGGHSVTKFGVAVNRKWQNKQTQEWEEKVSFFDCVAWGKIGENIAESFSKGDRVIITGRLDQQTWEDKETAAKRSKVEIVVEDLGGSVRFATVAVTKNPKTGGGGFSDGAPLPTPDFDTSGSGEEPF